MYFYLSRLLFYQRNRRKFDNPTLTCLYIYFINKYKKSTKFGSLEIYLKDYFNVMLKKLKEFNIKKSNESPIF